MLRWLLLFVVIDCVAIFLVKPAQASTAITANNPTRVQTEFGPVRGQLSQSGSTQVWLGVPYAQAPVGELRWHAPNPPLPWTKELQANAYGSACPQIGFFYGPPPVGKKWGASNVEVFGKPVGNEDCLKLNIWRPSNAVGPMPVIVFIHGGSNVVGHSADPIYDGEKLALATHALIVTINYRLGIFGWLAHPALEGQDPLTNSGNYAILDIIQALHFIQSNAVAFGADPRNITVMGQSAGAGNAYSLMGSPLAQGLFQKAIVLSGLLERQSTKQEGYAFTDSFIDQLLIDDHLAATQDDAVKYAASKSLSWKHDYLKSKTTDQLLNAMALHHEFFRAPHGFRDGSVFPDNAPLDIEEGRIQTVPMIIGTTRDESKLLFPFGIKKSGQEMFGLMRKSNPDAAPVAQLSDIVSSYLLPDVSPALYNTAHWGISTYLHRKVIKSISIVSKHNRKVFAYRFDWDDAPQPWHTVYGACHACDLPFIFDNFSDNFFSMEYPQKNKAGREALSATMMNAIGTFIRTGDPNSPTLHAIWTPWDEEGNNQQSMVFNATDRGVVLTMQ